MVLFLFFFRLSKTFFFVDGSSDFLVVAGRNNSLSAVEREIVPCFYKTDDENNMMLYTSHNQTEDALRKLLLVLITVQGSCSAEERKLTIVAFTE